MSFDVPLIQNMETFPEISSSVRLAIILPTVRWTPSAQSILASTVGIANEEIAVLIADNSENPNKQEFLKSLRNINPHVHAVAHSRDVGAKANMLYLLDWSRRIEFVAQMADDDCVSPTYHPDAFRVLLSNPQATCAEAGSTLVDVGDGKLVNVSQHSMDGSSPIERMAKWNGVVARATMYNVARRKAMNAAIQYLRTTPLNGITLVEDLWELNRLAQGDFLHDNGHGFLVHYPAMGSRTGDPTQRSFEGYFKDTGLQYPFVFFGGLSTAVQCAMFLMGKLSPIGDSGQRTACGQHVFRHIFMQSFLPVVSTEASQAAAAMLFAKHPKAMEGFKKYCNPPFSQRPVIDRVFIDWFIEIIKVLEIKPEGSTLSLSDRFGVYVNSIFNKDYAIHPD